MAKSKVTTKSRTRAHSHKRTRDEIATPAEVLKAHVFIINDQAKTRPANRLIGNSPDATIRVCQEIIFGLAVMARPGGSEQMVIIHPQVLNTVVDALDHAAKETKGLWEAAKSVAGVANG